MMNPASRLVLPLLAAAWLAACGGGDVARQLTDARNRLEQQDFGGAAVVLKTVIQKDPNAVEPRVLLGRALLGRGETVAAEIELRRAMELGAAQSAVVPSLATVLLANGKSETLLSEFGGTRLDDLQAQVQLQTHLALAHGLAGRLDRAWELNEAALRAAPAHLPAQVLRVRLMATRGEADAALREAAELTRTAPDRATVWLLQGDMLNRVNADPQPALAAYRRALQIQPDLPPAHAGLLGILVGQREVRAAVEQVAAMKRALPHHPDSVYFEGLVAFLQNEPARARTAAQTLLKSFPEVPRFLLLGGEAELELRSFAQAEALLAKAAAAAPGQVYPKLRLAHAQLRAGRPEKALATLQPLTTGERPDADALVAEGQVLLESGDARRAQASFTRAARAGSTGTGVRMGTGLALIAEGREDAGFAELRAAARDAAKDPAPDLAAIAARIDRRQWDAALQAIDALQPKMPGEVVPDLLRARIGELRGDRKAARAAYERVLSTAPGHPQALQRLTALDIADGEVAAARGRFEAVLKDKPEDLQALLMLVALRASEIGSRAAVDDLLARAVKAAPQDREPYLATAALALQRGEPAAAVAAARQGLAQIPDDPELIDRLGVAELAAGDAKAAVATFTKLAALKPDSGPAQLRLADALRQAQDLPASDRAVRQALQIAPGWALAQEAALRLSLRDGRVDEALAFARSLQTRQPEDAIGWRLEGEVEAQRNRWEAAAAAYRRAATKREPGDAAQKLHGSLVRAGRAAEADAWAGSWLREHPDDAAFRIWVAEDALVRGNFSVAEAQWRSAVQLRPNDAPALNNLAFLLARLGRPGAVALAERAVALQPRNTDFLDTLGAAYAADRRFDDALRVQTQAVELAPLRHGLRLGLARTLLAAGQRERARAELQRLDQLGRAFSEHAEVTRLLRSLGGA